VDNAQINVATVSNSGLQDAGFESPNVGTGTFSAFQYDPSGTPWIFSGSAGVAGNQSGFTSGSPNAPEGTQVGFLQSTGSFSQTVNLTAGSYQISFQAAQRANWGGAQSFQVLVGGQVVGTFSNLSISYTGFTTNAFAVAAGNHTIAFQGLDPDGGDDTAFVDNAQINVATVSNSGLQDAGFESPNVGTGTFGAFQYDPTGVAWSFSGNAGVAGNQSGFTSGNPNAPEGSQVGFLQMTGSFSQTVNLQAGSYLIGFRTAQRANWGGAQSFQVLVDGQVVGTFSGLSTAYTAQTTNPFTVTAGNHTITFQGLDPDGGDDTAFIDQVSLNAVTVNAPPAPNNLIASAGNAQVNLSWSASSGASSYNVYRATASGAETLIASGITGTAFTDTAVSNGTTYFYQVTALNSAGESSRSSEISALPQATQVAIDWNNIGGANVPQAFRTAVNAVWPAGATATGIVDRTADTSFPHVWVLGADVSGQQVAVLAGIFAPGSPITTTVYL
jgi:hypothetical protein